MNLKNTVMIFCDVASERIRQDAQWGGPAHDDRHGQRDWRSYREKFENRARSSSKARRADLIKIAALAVAEVESIDRSAERKVRRPSRPTGSR